MNKKDLKLEHHHIFNERHRTTHILCMSELSGRRVRNGNTNQKRHMQQQHSQMNVGNGRNLERNSSSFPNDQTNSGKRRKQSLMLKTTLLISEAI